MGPAWKGAALVLTLAVVGAGADALLKLASGQPRPFWNRWFFLGLLTSMVFAGIWVLLMQSMKLATAGVSCAVVSALLLVAIGTLCFGEKLNVGETTGVILALGAVILLGRLGA